MKKGTCVDFKNDDPLSRMLQREAFKEMKENNDITVIKRDGRKKPYDIDRIKSAIGKALIDFENNDKGADFIAKIVDERIQNKAYLEDKDEFTVEEIQDIVEDILKRYDINLYKVYHDYRVKRTAEREKDLKLFKDIQGIIDGSNVEALKENANKKGYMNSTQRDLMAGEVSRAMARRMIPKDIMDAHDLGAIKLHDLDYFVNPIFNCDLINLEDMLQNGTVINNKLIEKPKSLSTAMNVVTQIAAQVASSQYGGQTITLTHLAPFVRISRQKIEEKYAKYDVSEEVRQQLIEDDFKKEIKDSVQTFNYQINTLQTCNGQSPFESVCIYLNENPEYANEVAILAEEIFKQRLKGMKNKFGIESTQTFPKLLYFLDENNTYEGSEYFWLTELAVKCTSVRMNPDYMSVKKMKEVVGYAFPTMGCRALLSPWFIDGKPVFYGRGNLGVQTVNLPFVALESKRDNKDFFEVLDKYLDLCRRMGEIRYEKLKGVKAEIAPILWQYGAISRLNPDDDIIDVIDKMGFTVTLGYSGIYDAVKVLTGESHTTEKGHELALKIICYLEDKCKAWKEANPHTRFALYGTPQESSTDFFCKAIRREFGEVEDVTTKGYIVNSYHVDPREEIDAFSKFSFEATLQDHSLGGAVSYCETYPMQKNPQALLKVVQHIYETIMYGEINFESDTCGECGLQGVMEYVDGKWTCPNCGNNDIKKLTVCRRVCGYLSDDGTWNEGRTKDILSRVKHL